MTSTVYVGDCLDVLPTLPEASVHAVVMDPPYGIGFMGKEWDSGKSFFERSAAKANTFDHVGGNHNPTDSRDAARTRLVEGRRFEAWCRAWAVECLRVLKPGGHLLAFGGTRTSHRVASAIEDSGFEIRDSIIWLYGSGFPKALDVERAIAVKTCSLSGRHFASKIPKEQDRRKGDHVCPSTPQSAPWDGWGTALKPGHEPIVVARKPLIGTVQANVEQHGAGALNIDACRLSSLSPEEVARSGRSSNGEVYGDYASVDWKETAATHRGRWPANVVLSHSYDCTDERCEDDCPVLQLDRQSGGLTSGANPTRRGSDKFREVYGRLPGQERAAAHRGADSGGASRFFYVAKASRAERNLGLDDLEERPLLWSSGAKNPGSFQSEGTHRAARNYHPTVKPLDLMRHLVRLVTPPGGTVLDPFTGSGTTGCATAAEGFHFIGIEREADYVEIARRRIEHFALAAPHVETDVAPRNPRPAQETLL